MFFLSLSLLIVLSGQSTYDSLLLYVTKNLALIRKQALEGSDPTVSAGDAPEQSCISLWPSEIFARLTNLITESMGRTTIGLTSCNPPFIGISAKPSALLFFFL